MTIDHDEELRSLRERAYGPGADIHDDPVALARLNELEAAAEREPAVERAGAAPRDDADAGPTPSEDPEAEASVPPVPSAPDADQPEAADREAAEPQAGRGRRLTRRVAWLWAGSVVLALFVGAALALAMASWSGERAAVLAETDISDWPELSFGEPEEGSRIFEDYLGLTPVIVPNALGSDNQQRVPCMFVVILSDYDGGDPPGTAATTVTAGCASGAFPPVASFTVTDASPESLREQLPVGTSVRFTIEGDEAHVAVRRP
jgi:hypothetical protein